MLTIDTIPLRLISDFGLGRAVNASRETKDPKSKIQDPTIIYFLCAACGSDSDGNTC